MPCSQKKTRKPLIFQQDAVTAHQKPTHIINRKRIKINTAHLEYRASASVLLLAFKMRQWDAGKKQGGTLQGGFLDFFRSWDPLTHFELFAFCFMLKP